MRRVLQPRTAVERVAEERMPDRGEVDPHLVAPRMVGANLDP